LNAGLTAVMRRAARLGTASVLLAAVLLPRTRPRTRVLAGGALVGLWSAVYRRYWRRSRAQTALEFELLKTVDWDVFSRHYNERVPTIKEEFELWGSFHQHRHEMRYDLVADQVRAHVPNGGLILDVGCGAALVAERIRDVDATYVGLDFPAHHIKFAADEFRGRQMRLRTEWVRGDGERLPFRDATVDVLVMSEVIEHLIQPALAVWELSRVLKPGGVFVMTTNNASEVPLRSPVSDLFAWLEKGIGATHPSLISLRPWVWPEAVHESLTPPGSGPVYVPHTHHIYAQTRDLFAAAGLTTFWWSTFEFPPPQAASVAWLDRHGEFGKRTVDAIEAVAQRTPFVRRLGCHLFMLARKDRVPVEPQPPAWVWPGPFSGARV
jgi:ubiquinone/menaquinone biosynthesis C-methylase UbiE